MASKTFKQLSFKGVMLSNLIATHIGKWSKNKAFSWLSLDDVFSVSMSNVHKVNEAHVYYIFIARIHF